MNRGLFVVLEGGEGSGKTTTAKKLVEYYNNNGYKAVYVREPGGDETAEKIRDIAINSDIDPYTQLLLFLASRKLNVDHSITPALDNKCIVICDRFTLSTIVYQGVVQKVPLYIIKYMTILLFYDIKPDIEIVLDVDPVVGLNRVFSNDREKSGLDKKGLEFHTAINNAYKQYASDAEYRFSVNTTDSNQDEVFNQCKGLIDHIINISGRNNNE